MVSPDLTVYVDTNCFIQLRDLQDLPWKEIAPAARKIEIAIPRAVITELDRMKSDRSSDRRRNRSRKALVLIKDAIDSLDQAISLENNSIDLTLRICVCANLPWEEHPNLDRLSADDNLVLCALVEKIEGNKVLLTADTGPYLSAKLAGLNALVPPESWRIPTDDNGEAEEITKLRRLLAEAKATKPEIDIVFLHGTEVVNVFEFTSLRLPALPSGLQELLLNDLMDFYHKVAHPDSKFTKRVQKYFADLHHGVYGASNTNEINFQLRNSSSVTALKLLAEVRVPNRVWIFGDKDEIERLTSGLALPVPEHSVPAPVRDFDFPIMPPYRSNEKPRDPTAFHWQERPGFESNFASSICEEFRARQEFEDQYWITRASRDLIAGSIDVEISATNLAGPVRRQAGLRMMEKEATWTSDEVRRLVPEWLSNKLAKYLG
jgi:hypothetical protein